MKENTRNLVHGLLWISPWVVGTLFFLIVPVLISLYISFTDYSLLEEPAWVGLGNYKEMAHDPVFWKALRNTGVYALSCVVLGTIASVLIAVLLEQRLRGRGLVQGSSLEGSSVDVAIEFSRLILAQRGFQINSRTISAANETLQELANIIR